MQGDLNSNVLNITLVDGLNPYNLTGTNVEIVFAKPDRTTVIQDSSNGVVVINATEGKIQCTLSTNTIASPGKVVAEVRVLSAIDDILLTSTRFGFYVRKAIFGDDTIKSTNEWPLLKKLLVVSEEESIRQSNEEERIQNEQTREDNEEQRIIKETERINSENERIANEKIRIENENIRQSNEDIRKSNELKRIENEDARQSNENIRISQEESRESNETIRQQNESKRESNEANRISNELARESNEAARIANENARVQAENVRAATFAGYEERISTVENDLIQHKLDYASQRQQDQLKLAKVEKDINDYKQVMSQVNINQEATQKASGYGIISLPKNAANGQVNSVKLKGLTATNIVRNGDFRNGIEGWVTQGYNTDKISVVDRVAVNELENVNSKSIMTKRYINFNEGDKIYIKLRTKVDSLDNIKNFRLINGILGTQGYTNLTPTTEFTTHSFITTWTDGECLRLYLDFYTEMNTKLYLDYIMAINLTEMFGAGNEPTVEECDAMFPYYFEGTKSTVSAIRLKSVSEDETQESVIYLPNVGELRSLPNGIKDEIRVSEGKAIINTKKHILQPSDINFLFLEQEVDVVRILLPTDCKDVVDTIQSVIYGDRKFIPYASRLDVSNVGAYSLINAFGNNFLFLTVAKGTYATLAEAQSDLAGTQLIYQLATPIEIPIEVVGTLLSYPSGTVYVENVVADAGVYNDGITVLHQDLPIKQIESLYKVDFQTGLEYPLDISQCIISQDKLSFTHPELQNNDIVFFTYEYDVESTKGLVEMEHYDSRYVVKDDVTGKFYKWNIKVSNGVPSIVLEEV